MTTMPTVDDLESYLGGSSTWSRDEVGAALAAEADAQATACKVPGDGAAWPAALAESLMRRVAHNLALRALPLGVQASIYETGAAQIRVGGLDAEVRRLEAPYRKRVVG